MILHFVQDDSVRLIWFLAKLNSTSATKSFGVWADIPTNNSIYSRYAGWKGSPLRILFIGDIFGEPGRQAVGNLLPELKENLSIDFVIANGENSAGGVGITKEIALELLRTGVNSITLGNHAWSKKEVYSYLDEDTRVIRPANYPPGIPGRGVAVYNIHDGTRIGVLNLCGRVFMDHIDDPFRIADKIIENLAKETDVILIDFHAEATSEKIAFGWYVDGRVSAVIGTHTHVQTADERVLPGGTAYITDVGMTGPMDSVIGVKKELIISKFLTRLPHKFEVADGEILLSAVVIDIDAASGKATCIERLRVNPARLSRDNS